MVSQKDLEDLKVRDWNEVAENFEGADVLLGNGFSLQFYSVFNYGSLFDKFIENCSPTETALFRSFGTTNFESIQKQLLDAKKVNDLLGIPSDPIQPAIARLREGLIEAVNENHPLASEINSTELSRISKDLDRFENVFTLNYDLLLYRIIMLCKDRSRSENLRKYNDYFWERHNANFNEFRDYNIYNDRQVYYLHGALFLFPGERFDYYNDLKLVTREEGFSELLDEVTSQVRAGRLPLFVSEGESNDKRRFISTSPYLSFAYRHLEESQNPLVIYGWSASQQDQHISDAIGQRKQSGISKRDLAVSLYIGNKSYEALEVEIHNVKSKLPGHRITFFDSRTLFVASGAS